MKNDGYILMLEGDSNDRELTSEYISERQIRIDFFQSSHEIIPFLENINKSKLQLPRLIILSMNSVPDSGLDVLKQIKTIEDLKHIPVIVLGENTQPDLIKSCYAGGANTFINKPFTNNLTDVKIKSFLHYWFDVAEPSGQGRIHYS